MQWQKGIFHKGKGKMREGNDMNHEVKQKRNALKPDGSLAERGYATRMNFIYNKECVKGFPFKLKEWNFYQFQNGDYVVQMTLGHLTYIGQVCVNLINIRTGEKQSISAVIPFAKFELDKNPEEPSVNEYKDEKMHIRYEVTATKRVLTFKGQSEEYKNVEVQLVAENDVNNDKLVIATPFEKPTQFYLNYKENYYKTEGFVAFDDIRADFNGATGVFDWGRGVWPYTHEWYWGTLTGWIGDSEFGFNIGWGFGDLSHATENIFFYKKKGYKLGKLIHEWDNNNIMKPQHIHDPENKLDMTFTPFFNHETENKFVVIDTHCDQIYGTFAGTIQTEEGLVEFDGLVGFIEHAVNRW